MPYTEEVAKLPLGWTPTSGLFYPMILVVDGGKKIINTYKDHHKLIQHLFLGN